MKEKRVALCDECGHGQIPQRSRGNVRCSKCGSRKVTRGSLDEVLEVARKRVLENRSRTVKDDARARVAGTRTHTSSQKRPRQKASQKPRGRKKAEDTEQSMHKRLGITSHKLETIIAKFKDAAEGRRASLDDKGRPVVAEEQNVNWIEVVGKVDWMLAHKIYHEVLMRGLPCDLEVGYKPLEYYE